MAEFPGVVFEPHAQRRMQRGVNQIVDVVRPTLGPCPRIVAVENTFRSKTPELLDSAGLISRRIIQLADRGADMGAMLLRNVLWRVQEAAGDGTATAAVLFQAVYSRGLTYVAAGGNPLLLRRHLERGMALILEELDRQTLPVAGAAQLAHLAESLCFDHELARVLGEIFDIVGEHGLVDVRLGHGRALERQYIEGSFWAGGLLSPHLAADQARYRTDLTQPAILLTDLEIDDARQLMPLFDSVFEQQYPSVLVVANKISDQAVAMLLGAARAHKNLRVAAVQTPGTGTAEQAAALEELALLTGGRPLLQAAGDTLRGLRPADLGRARRAWADRSYLGIIGGKGDPRAIQRQIGKLRAAFDATEEDAKRAALQKRIGKLQNGAAAVIIGGSTESEITVRQENARKTAGLLRAAMRGGVLPGGGVALLACREALRSRIAASADTDERAAFRILLHALAEPLRAIAANAGHDASAALARVERAAPGQGLDARSGELADMAAAGILDVAEVQKIALRSAISGAATMLTVDAVVHTRAPLTAAQP